MWEEEEFVDEKWARRGGTRMSRENLSWWARRTRLERHLALALTAAIFVSVFLVLGLASFLQNRNQVHSHQLEHALPEAQALLKPKNPEVTRNPSELPSESPSTLPPASPPALPPPSPSVPSTSNSGNPSSVGNPPGIAESSSNVEDTICLTKGCVKAAAAVIERMNETWDPCEDFFEFSCAGFVQNTIIPDEKSRVTMISNAEDKLMEKMRLLVENEIKDTDSFATKMVKTLYGSCTDTDTIEDLGLEPIQSFLAELGGWPLVDGEDWNEEEFSWTETNYKSREHGFFSDTLFELSIISDLKNSTWRMIWFDQPDTGLSREYLVKGLDDSDVKAYLKYAIDVAELLGADPQRAEEEMREALNFEISIANISLAREKRRNITNLYNVMTLSEMQLLAPDIPLVEYVNQILPANLNVDENERVGVSYPNYFKNLTELLVATPKRVVANYIMWRLASTAASYLSEEIRNVEFEFTKIITGKTTREPRWKECLKKTSKDLDFAISNLYVKNFFNEDAKAQAEELVEYIRDEFGQILNEVDWMDDRTRGEAHKKANAIKAHIGYPQDLLQDQKLSDYYGDLIIDSSYFDNMKRIQKFNEDKHFIELREKVDKLDWKRHSNVAIINAYYNSIENSIKFPAGILQGVFFEPDRPKYMNFGGIGYVIGHEVTHGFDDQGKQFDADGNLQNWWEQSTEQKFLEKARCIIYQYGNYTAPENGMNLNGINTQGENIADNGGIKEAYNAYKKWVDDNGPEKKLPGLEYTPNQMFWISAAQVWCSRYRPESLKMSILTGVHSPGRFRIIGSFSNSEEFSRDFNCPAGTNMNPRNRCTVW